MFQLTHKIFSHFYTRPNSKAHPTFVLALVGIHGYAGTLAYFNFSLVLMALLLIINLYFFFSYKRAYALVSLCTITFIAAYLYTALHHHHYLHKTLAIAGKKNTFYATVQDNTHTGDLQKINLAAYDEKFSGTIHVYSKQDCPLKIGDLIHVENVYIPPLYKSSYKNYLEKEWVHASVHVKKLLFSIKGHEWSLRTCITQHLHRVERALKEKIQGPTYALFKRLFLGSNTRDSFGKSTEVQQLFNNWGIDHFLARSGLHVTLLLFLLNLSILALISNIRLKAVLSLCFLFAYALFSYSSSSFARAAILSLFMQACMFLKIPLQPFYLFLLTACALLAYNPIALLFLDFQLTLLITGALSIVAHINRNRVDFSNN